MILFYYALLCLIYAFCALPLLVLSFCKEKYKQSFKARFFLYKNLHQDEASVHFHACSFGEVKSIKELAINFDSRITTITQTGFEEAQSFCKKLNYLAFEIFIPFWLKPCKVLVIFEAELWLMLVCIAKLKGAKIILINARISEPSFAKYQKFTFFYKKIFSYIDEVFAQSKADKVRLESLGAKNVHEFFNIKAALKPQLSKNYEKQDNKKLILFASTHEGEEELLLQNLKLEEDEILCLAPRHPERFDKVKELLKEYALRHNLSFACLSELKNSYIQSDVLLIDTLGELVNFYAICDISVLCGSFLKGIGGHNPIEIAHFQKILISGTHIHNQIPLYKHIENVYFCEDPKDLNTLIHSKLNPSKIKDELSLEPIISSIQANIKEGIHARKSL
ncbi:3-deoxy-D-manno-octulosonic acid transferase [Campylobacter sp. MIT 12-8780]|uniref:lipid IV(A) 3-deoxy-D-manno-octulosonic acid transferase n=1 Tax=Campylobacter sp. MIT 12-8780 TaxID=2202200 RepID=UPI00115CA3D0|nr:lipid IV(A) 3-deoxy-D-manno-octulosonic acid transferase [Campylobacter sp. MIT 12-8780]TQR41232.1 3-deoxy-D-manno-octulosonic acid transferase [Campylobacter sp. MIT 12-8780]